MIREGQCLPYHVWNVKKVNSEVDGVGAKMDDNIDKSSETIAKIIRTDKHEANTNVDNNKEKSDLSTNDDSQVTNPFSLSSKTNDKGSTIISNSKQSPKILPPTNKLGVKSVSPFYVQCL